MADLRYPAEIIFDTTDWFSVGISSYISGDLVGSGTTDQYVANISNSIILPMPSNIQDGNSVSYNEDNLNSITAAALGVIEGGMSIDVFNLPTSVANAKDKINTAITGLGMSGQELSRLFNKTLAAEAVGVLGGNVSIGSLLARESGQIFNPNLELLFNGVTLRTFRFSFKMTPRDNRESDNIRKIIYTLKQNMSAQAGAAFLGTPNVFTLEYKKGNQPHPFLHKFKPCFLKDMSVNYTGENVYATYSDGTPVSMIMDLTFQEIFPIYSSDYRGFSETNATQGVGF